MAVAKKRATKTSTFGVSKRESHDASDFYDRFPVPVISDDETVKVLDELSRNQCVVGDSRDLSFIPDNSVALMVTSPPYFAGKAYEEVLGQGHVPDSYVSYLQMLRDVFAETYRVLEPGGRVAINVANLGRKPYRSLAADLTRILQDDLGYLLRGEVVWIKAEGASGNCAWGSFAKATNPALRDVTERIIVASKGRFDRAIPPKRRQEMDLPYQSTISKEDFMAWTLDTWRMQPESAKRAGHPAPYPVELPRRFIELYTFEGDVVLDPFLGSGSTAIAALQTGRHYLGVDVDPLFVAAAERRIDKERQRLGTEG